jgi:hypothetical protein
LKRGRATLSQANGRAEAALLALYGLRSMRSIEHGFPVKFVNSGGDMSETSNSPLGRVRGSTYSQIQAEQEAPRSGRGGRVSMRYRC